MPKGLYAVRYKPDKAPDKSKPWCVVNTSTGTVNGRWHATKSEALSQLKAMYSSMGDKAVKMNSEISHLFPLKQFAEAGKLNWLEGNQLWIQQYPFDSWSHPIFGETTIDRDRALKLKESFDKGIRGQKIFSDYEHGLDPAKGNKASGQILELKVIDEPRGTIFTQPGLWARVQFTENARKEIDDGEWNYWSASHYDEWTHPQTKETHELVYDGGGVTNKPYVKGMAPLNFSEVGITQEQAEAATPEEIDPVEIVEDVPVVDNGNENNDEGGDNDVKLEEFEKTLRSKLGIADDADIVTAVGGLVDEVTPMREALKVHNEKKQFSEMFPAEAKRMEELEKLEQERQARQFSESFSNTRLKKKVGDNDEETTLGYSALVLGKIENLAKQFSEGTANIGGVKELMEAIADNGIVDYGTKGSSRENTAVLTNPDEVPSGGMREVRKAFAEKVTEIMREDKIENYGTAVALAADKYPNLADAYRSAGMG